MDLNKLISLFKKIQVDLNSLNLIVTNIQNASNSNNTTILRNHINSYLQSVQNLSSFKTLNDIEIKILNDLRINIFDEVVVNEILFPIINLPNNQNRRNKINGFITSFNKVRNLSNYLSNIDNLNIIPKDASIEDVLKDGFKLFFIEDISIETVKDLGKEMSKWNKVLIGFARLARENDTDFKIFNVKKGSLIIDIASVAGTTFVIAKAINEVLKIVNNTLQLKKFSLEIQKLKGDNTKNAIKELDKISKINTKSESEKIAKFLLDSEKYDHNDVKEVTTALNYSVSQMINFYSKGGKIEVLLSSPDTDEKKEVIKEVISQNEKFRIQTTEIKSLINENDKINLIEDPQDDE